MCEPHGFLHCGDRVAAFNAFSTLHPFQDDLMG